jgi:LysM repeat protein
MLLRGGAKPARAAPQGLRHLVWVWQFATDGAPNLIGARLRDAGLGILLKTHDGRQWMSEYDRSPFAVSGPAQVAVLARYYEDAGVPFHAWTVVHGRDPVGEARLAAEVLSAGARSIFLDVEPHSGFWSGSPADAEAYGRELRRLQPSGQVVLSLDPRPWVVARLPLPPFLAFSDELAPQNYWLAFNTPANHTRYAESGFPVGPDGITPEFLMAVNDATLKPLGLPIVQAGQGATQNPDEWRRFIDLTYASGSDYVTAWRYGVTPQSIIEVLRDTPPRLPPAVEALGVHVVQPGDTLGKIATTYGTSVEALAQANGIENPNYIYVGQEIKVPGAADGPVGGGIRATSAPQPGPRTYTVVQGDTLYAIAGRHGTSVDAIVKANSLANPDFLSIGQVLQVP